MKKLFTLFLAAALALSLAACGGGEAPSAPEPQSPPASTEPAAPSDPGEPSAGEPVSQPGREWDLEPGKVLPDAEALIWNTPYTNDGLWELGTEKEWEAFQDLLQTGDISCLGVSQYAVVEAEFPVEQEREVLKTLENAQPGYYQKFENPATGNEPYFIGAYDPEGELLFVVSYDKFWFTVTFSREDGSPSYLFDGEKMDLELPSLEQYVSDPPLFTPAPGEIISMDDPRLAGSRKHDYGTQADLDRWYSLIQTARIARLAVCRTGAEPGALSPEAEGQIRAILQKNIQLSLYPPETKEDPVTGGGVTIIACDSQGQQLFAVTYLGNWFTVRFGEEETEVIFNGEADEDLDFLLTMDLS